jgi:RNA polymerase sigma-70 factor (ECF subfamily)
MQIRERRELPLDPVELPDTVPDPEQALDQHVMRDWVWHALDRLPPDERLTLMLRHFTRCTNYDAIARVTAVPLGAVRSRLNRARSRLAGALTATIPDATTKHAALEAARREQWEDFYRSTSTRCRSPTSISSPQTSTSTTAPTVGTAPTNGQPMSAKRSP